MAETYDVQSQTVLKRSVTLSEDQVESILVQWAKDHLQFGGTVELNFDVDEYLRGVTIRSTEVLP